MVTLRHAFDANSMKGLVIRILRGNYPAIPATYSEGLKQIIAEMLIKDPQKRPSMRKILEKDFLSRRISNLLTMTIARNEFSNTFVTRHLTNNDGQPRVEEIKTENNSTVQSEPEQQSIVIQKQKITISKDPKKKPKKLEIVQGTGTSAA